MTLERRESMKLRLYSTPQSALNLEVTYLAIFEVFVSMAVYMGIALYFDTLKHLMAAVIFAPLMLFRTEEVARMAPRALATSLDFLFGPFDRLHPRVPLPVAALVLVLPICVFLIPISFAIRVIGTAFEAARRPIATLRAAPDNWVRQAFCTDFAHPPEIVPGMEAYGDEEDDYDWAVSRLVPKAWGRPIGLLDWAATVFILPVIAIALVPPIMYRVSFKATSLVYGPLVWVVGTTLHSDLSGDARLQRIAKGQFEKVRRIWAGFVLVLLGAKLLLFLGLITPDVITKRLAGSEILMSVYVMPQDLIVPWQVAEGLAAILTFFLFWGADAAIPRVKAGSLSTGTTDGFVSVMTFTRGVVSIYTVFCLFYITIVAATDLPWPELGTKVLPWF